MTSTRQTQQDALLACLATICRQETISFSPAAVTAGLALVNNKLTPSLFVEAAERVGLAAKIGKRHLADIPDVLLPVILILKNNKACILQAKTTENKLEVILPEESDEVKLITVKELEKQHEDYVILVRPAVKFEKRAEQFHSQKETSWFWNIILNYKGVYFNVLLAALLTNLFVLVAPLFIMNVYDRVVPNQAFETLWVLAIGAILFFAFDLAARLLRSYLIDMAGRKADIMMSAKMFGQAISLRLANKPKSSGAFANFFNEFESLREFFTSATLIGFVDLPFVFLFLFVIWLIGGSLVLVPLIAVPVVIVVAMLIERPAHAAVKEALVSNTLKTAVLVESISALESLKSISAEGQMQKKWDRYVAHASKYSMKARLFASLAINITIWIQQIVTIGVVVYGVYLINVGALTIGGLIAVTILSGRAVMLGQVVNLLTRYEQSREALQGLSKIMQLPTERTYKSEFLYRPELKGNIQFDKVSFSYPEQNVAALDELNLTIKAGEKVGIIGRIASGKTTLLKVLAGFYEPTSGAVLIDGTHNNEIDTADLRNNVNYAASDGVLFYGSVRDNIAMANPKADDEMILAAAEIAGVSSFAQKHPAGYEMEVGERGEQLSSGQRQAVILARALVADKPILLLDEPTAAMDSKTEREFKDSLGKHVNGKTMLLVTHRATMLDVVDRVVIVENGKVVADGPRAEVLKMIEEQAQFQGKEPDDKKEEE